MKHNTIVLFAVFLILVSCKNHKQEATEEPSEGRVPVTIVRTEKGLIEETVTLNAVSAFRMKSYAKASINGYLSEVNITPGEKVSKGKRLFMIHSKEAHTLGSTISRLDSTFQFKGVVPVVSPTTGYIVQLNYQEGDYVQEGEQLATIADAGSMVFLLELPYELRPFLPLNKTVELTLPDNTVLKGTLQQSLPTVDPVAQTQQFVVRIGKELTVPENLVAQVRFLKKQEQNAVTVPKDAVLTNEVQSEYWVMKLINDSTAVKVPVSKGIETDDRIELLSPTFSPEERILVTGNYGLQDTSLVRIVNAPR